MEKELLKEIYSDIKQLNTAIKNEINSDMSKDLTPIKDAILTNVGDFISSIDHRTMEEKIINLNYKRALKQQLTCVQMQKEQLKKILD